MNAFAYFAKTGSVLVVWLGNAIVIGACLGYVFGTPSLERTAVLVFTGIPMILFGYLVDNNISWEEVQK